MTTATPNRDLDAIASVYDPSKVGTAFDWHLKRMEARAILQHVVGDQFLELGCATGELAGHLEPVAKRYTIIEAAMGNIETTRLRLPNAEFLHGYWEVTNPEGLFSDIVCACVLEHAADPQVVLRRCREWLRPGGRLHVCVPNGLSLHRQAAARMGMLTVPWEVNDSDRAQGHWRNYTLDTLLAELRTAGWTMCHFEGIGLKVTPGSMMADWPSELIDALDQVGKQLGNVAAELYVTAEMAPG
jgi:2-polyprenyl-3-methyl-5-hydroxy-6-metoxy-1,4-benzoquinol methylase